ncbi:MAG TPA: ArsA-related P-loop ATPase [Candidatus Limnocylindrales bacterium]|nr:ArsA-related P-loop ATPase [Candidatus Limnocylindrales bacterium]
MSVARLLDSHRIVVCVGSGGVGKTTVAAALALQGALAGKRAMVLTIDPARRLAQSLGLDTLRAGGERIAPERLSAQGLDIRGSLSAGMLDQKSAWDEFIARHSPNEQVRETILQNEFYQHLSRSFAGSTEYMAIEELARIDESGQFDLIVLDTPPTGHALDFLEAPARLEDFFDRGMLSWLLRPSMTAGWMAWKTASRGVRFLFEKVEEATGVQALAQIADFFTAIEHLVDGITERGRRVRALLQGDKTAFVLVSGPDEQVLEEADDLYAKMRGLGMPLKGVVMNRVHLPPPGLDGAEAGAAIERVLDLVAADNVRIREWLGHTVRNLMVQAAAEEVRREDFEANLPTDVLVTVVPEQRGDVHDLAELARLGEFLKD